MRLALVAHISVAVAVGICMSSASAAGQSELVYVPNSTKRICQLTGDLDRTSGMPTLSQTGKRFGVESTDLGSSFEHKGRLYFLFGDTNGRPGARDAVAWTTSANPAKIVLEFFKAPDGKWLPPTVPGISLGAFEIPSGGISVGGAIYVVFTTDHTAAKTMGRSVLAVSRDDGRTWKMLYELSRDKFINVSMLVADGWLFIFGSGDYRKSTVCLARVRPNEIAQRTKLEFFGGIEPSREPKWSPREANATPLFPNNQIGEFSVAYLEPAKRLVMLYNSGKPRGIVMRSAELPRGPWSEGTVIFDPGRDDGYGHFIHISTRAEGRHDGLSDPGRTEVWGGEYGPYLMARFTTGSNGQCRIYYTMSTWNPYQVVVMQSDLKLAGDAK
ncbi:MAG TPA: DUF4185 domain-containing protein [Pirellulales bacterium]|nr:DUF4185 domain-containing protein [Pirellulales bacterium]